MEVTGAWLSVAVTVPRVSTGPPLSSSVNQQGWAESAVLCALGVFCLFRLTQEITLYEPVFSLWEMMNVLHVTEQPRGSSLGQQYQKCCVNVMLENSWSKFCFM